MKIDRKIAVVGLGYVGLPVAVSFGKQHEVIGFDINRNRIKELKKGYDRTNEIEVKDLSRTNIKFTSEKEDLTKADFIIIAVPTPINKHKQPDLTPLLKASETVGSVMQKGTIVVYESTVYPGATEDDCLPILEEHSGLKGGKDFFVGYSPERINPGDKEHTFETITKVVSGQTTEVLDIVAEVYESVVKAGIHKAENIKVAEAAKVIENTQRDLNIALMNELAIIFNKVGINTSSVLEAASTKWNFLKFSPGLVGGHCIGVDPYYLTHKAQELGHNPEVILAGRRINDSMPKHIASSVIKQMLKEKISVVDTTINLLGLTFKENTPDLRNTKIVEVINELEEYGMNVVVNDAIADPKEAKKFYDIDLKGKEELTPSEVIIFAVPHREYEESKRDYLTLLKDNGLVFDVKGIIKNEDLNDTQSIWRL